MFGEEINNSTDITIVFKVSEATVDRVIQNRIYASANVPSKDWDSIKKFILIGPYNGLGVPVIAKGDIVKISNITPLSKTLSVFTSDEFETWSVEYELSNISDLRRTYTQIEDVFSASELKKVRKVEQYVYLP